MKKLLTVLFAVSLLTACGDGQKQAKFQGVKADKDYITEGMEFLSKSDIPRAIQSFDKAIRQDPNNANNYIVLGQVYMRLKNLDRADDTFSAATKIDPKNGEAHFLLATTRMLSGDKEGAIDSAQKSVELFMGQRDEENFKRSVALLKGMTGAAGAPTDVAKELIETALPE